MKKPVIVGGAALLATLIVWRAWKQRQAQAMAMPAQAAPESAAAVGLAAPAQQAAQEAQGGSLPKLPAGIGTAAAVAVAGIKLQNALGDVAERVGGKGAGEVARVAPAIVGVGTIVGKGVQLGLESVGVANEPARVAGLVAGVAVVAGAPVAAGVAVAQAAGSLLQEGLKLVAGEKVERAVSNAVSQLDPFKDGSLANKAITPVANVVSWAGDVLGGKSDAEKQREAEEKAKAQQLAAQVLQANPRAAQQVVSAVSSNPLSLLQAAKQVLPAPAPPAPAPAPPFVPPVLAAVLPKLTAPPPAPPPAATLVPAPTQPPPAVDTVVKGLKGKFGGLGIGL